MPANTRTVAIIGARGHTGASLIEIIDRHEGLKLAAASSRQHAGTAVSELVSAYTGDLVFQNMEPGDVAAIGADVVILALPNGASPPYVEAVERARDETVIVDLSADHRVDDGWAYGLPEHFRSSIVGATRISNPGCYATAMQLALRPVLDFLGGTPTIFGVSGYSGAGATPSERNDPERLRDNLMPYDLADHVHEREVSHHLGRAVSFHPHVAAFFRGITITVSMPLGRKCHREEIDQRYIEAYLAEPLVKYLSETPFVRDVAHQSWCAIGGLTLDRTGMRAVVVATIDNLLKGAAVQAVQNINLACGFDEFEALEASPASSPV